jgi:hypothetical protein|tara:strand:- start:73 stop:219 length:147 start_codon:yes stop_codon:yes gene_type:complete
MKKFHIDEPNEIGKKKIKLSPKDKLMVKKDLSERVVEVLKKIKQGKIK